MLLATMMMILIYFLSAFASTGQCVWYDKCGINPDFSAPSKLRFYEDDDDDDFDEEDDDYDYDNLWPGSKIRLAKLMGCCDDNAFADKKLNCEYSGPPKAATEDQLQILQQICPHLVEEVILLYNF